MVAGALPLRTPVKLSVLIIDDEHDVREFLQDFLLTLEQRARRTELSASWLLQIERAEVSALSDLIEIATALHVRLTDLFAGGHR